MFDLSELLVQIRVVGLTISESPTLMFLPNGISLFVDLAPIDARNSTFVDDEKAAIPAAVGYLNWQPSRVS